METWERIAKWLKDNYTDEQFKKSAQIAGDKIVVADAAWRQLCLIPIDLLKTPNGQIDKDVHNSVDAFLLYHWDAGQMAGISLGNALCGQYNAGFTLLRSFLELILNGAFFQCLAQKVLRENTSTHLEPNDSLRLLVTHLSTVIRESDINDSEIAKNSMAIFGILRGDWMQYAFSLKTGSVIQQLTDWGIFNHLGDNPNDLVRGLYFRLSKNVHEIVEYTDAGRAIEEGKELFEWPTPVLSKSLISFLEDFHLAMEIGVIPILNILASKIPRRNLLDKARQLENEETLKKAHLKYASQLLREWYT
jgi:hypothetical protein